MSNEVHRFDVDAALDCVDLRFTGYIPSNDSLEFFNLIRIFTGQDFEIDTPIWHYFLADLLLGNIKREQFPYSEEISRSITVDPSAIAILASRGAAKSTVTTLFYPIYASIKGSTPVTGPLSHILILSDSQQGGSVSQARIMASAFEKSVFAQQWFESMRFTDTEIELVRRNQSDKEVPVEKRHMLIKFKGASTGGIRSGSRNPVTGDRYALVLCHKKGTIVTTDMGTHKVEDYYNVLGEREEHGLNVQVYGLPDIETVTNEHRYWAKTLTTQQVWDVDQKRLISVKTETAPTWVEAKDLTINHMIGSPITPQQILEAPKGIKKIGYTRRLSKTEYVSGFTESIEEVSWFNDPEFGFLFGFWLADGHVTKHGIAMTFGFTEKDADAKQRIEKYLGSLGKAYSIQSSADKCETLYMNDTHLSRWLVHNVRLGYPGGKQIPDFVYNLSIESITNIVAGYYHGDGYIDKNGGKGGQIRANSVCPELTYGIAKLCELLGLPYHIRYTRKKEIAQCVKGRETTSKKQLEIRLKDNVREVLGFDIDNGEQMKLRVQIQDGFVWRRVKSVSKTPHPEIFVPIQTPDHTYTTAFGLSHNCDDIIKNEDDSYSEALMEKVKTALESDAENAMRSRNTQMVIINTPFHKNDPLYKIVEGGAYTPLVMPICKEISLDLKKSEFIGLWEESHSYESVMKRYRKAVANNNTRAFNQELMLRVSNEEDRMITDSMLQWYDRKLIMNTLDGYNLYITTDFTTTSAAKSDFSGIAVWALNSENDWFLLDLHLKRCELQEQYDALFRMVSVWSRGGRAIDVGVEIDGQQKAHIFSLKQMMQKKNLYFSFARQKGAPVGREGILSKVGGNSKLERFRYTLPMFQNHKIYFPEQLKDTADMKEMMKHLKGATHVGFTTHDDGADLVSQLGLIDVITPSSSEALAEDVGSWYAEDDVWGGIKEKDEYGGSTIF